MELTAFDICDVSQDGDSAQKKSTRTNTMSVAIKSRLPFVRDKTMVFHPGDTLLETLENAGCEVNYQCREGYCGACRLTLVTGAVHYETEPMATRKANEILPCCCRPASDVELIL